MKPDMEDYADIDETRPHGSRAMSWMVLAVAVGGFAALAYYAYHSGTKSAMDGETLTVEADQSPIKEAPTDAGGEQFPDKDKTIYDVISPNGESRGVEKLMPDAERPVAAANVEDSEDNAPASASSAAPMPATGASTFVSPSAESTASTTSAPQNVGEVPVATTAKPVATYQPKTVVPAEKTSPVPTAPKSYANPQMVNEKPPVKKDAVVVAEKPAAKPAAKASTTGGSYQVQLGAFKSESEAQAAWKKLSGKHSAVLNGSPTIVKADVNGATFYRLRTGSFASSADAKSVCSQLGGAACMPVK